ncbi:MAG: O-antigen ligase family protein [Candidatus Omnitrophota bacterium]
MSINKQNCIVILDRVMEYSLYSLAYFLPISNALIEIFATIAIFAFLLKKVIIRKFTFDTFLDKPLLIYVVICGISVIFSTNFAISIRTFILKLAEYVLIFFVIIESMNSRKKIRNILTILFISSALICVDGLFQFCTHKDFIRNRVWYYDARPFTFRIMGPFISANDFAAYISPLLIINLSLIFYKFKNFILRIAFRILSLGLLTCLFLSFSRGAWLGFILGAIFIILFKEKRTAFILLFVILFFASIWFLYPQDMKAGFGALFNFSDNGVKDRVVLNRIGISMFLENPLTGVGLGTFMFNFERLNNIIEYSWGPTYAHNCFLQMLAETGVLGLTSFMFVIFTLFIKSVELIKKHEDSVYKNLSVGLLGGLLAYLVHSAFDTHFYSLQIVMIFWLLLGLLMANLRYLTQSEQK